MISLSIDQVGIFIPFAVLPVCQLHLGIRSNILCCNHILFQQILVFRIKIGTVICNEVEFDVLLHSTN